MNTRMQRSFGLLLLVALLSLVSLAAAPCSTEPSFSIAIIADPHLAGDPSYEAMLTKGVDWINSNREAERIELVAVVGDIGWPMSYLQKGKEILDRLNMPYLPLIGDNEIQGGSQDDFQTVFAPQYEKLSTQLPNWKKAALPVIDPATGKNLGLNNFSFDYKGLRLIGLDWASRVIGGWESEQAELWDIPGGTLGWLQSEIASSPTDRAENIVMLSHHAMHTNPASFSAEDYNTIAGVTGPQSDQVALSIAGHYHIYFNEPMALGGYDVRCIGAIHVNPSTLSVFEVFDNGSEFSYNENIINLK